MNIRGAKLILLILMLLVLMLGLSGCGALEKAEEEQLGAAAELGSYRSVCFGEQTFVAVGTGGRIDRISVDKMVTSLQSPVSQTLNGVAFANSRYVAVGDSGVIVVSGIDGAFQLIDAVTESDLLSVTEFGKNFVAVGREGTVLASSDGENWDELDVDVTNDFISVDSNGENCIAVTREGQVLVMKSLSQWDVLDYNEVYKDLGTTFHMRAICCCGQGYLVMGTSMDNDDVPVVFKTSDGELWTEIYLDTINNVMSNEFLPIRLNSAGVFEDQILIGADGGKLLTLTSCAECTKLTELTDHNINALAYTATANARDENDKATFGAYRVCNEASDRPNIKFPAGQEVLVNEVASRTKAAGGKTVVVIQSVGVMDVSAFEENVDAIIWTAYNGMRQGEAHARVLFGDYNPGGHLTQTWYADDSQLYSYPENFLWDYSIDNRDGKPGRTYMYYNGTPRYPFGYGLSYTNFVIDNMSVSDPVDGIITVTADVTNTGDVDGAEVV